MNERVVVDPITRIEGHLRIEADTEADGRISSAWSSGTAWAGAQFAIPCAHTRVVPVTCPLAIPACIWAMLYGPPSIGRIKHRRYLDAQA